MNKTDSLDLVLRMQTEYGRRVMKGPTPNTEAQKLLKAGDMPGFENVYGSHYVAIERRGASVLSSGQ